MPRTAQINPDSPMAKAKAADEAHRSAVSAITSSFYDKLELKPYNADLLVLKNSRGASDECVYLDADSATWLVSQLIRIFGIAR